MKKGLSSTLVIIVILAVCLLWGWSSYNGLVKSDEGVQAAWSQVENVYQRRADLIPNLVATVKGYAEHESSTLEAVTEARTKATGINITADELTEDNIKKFQAAQSELSGALSRLIAVAENYPDLKASENFATLQKQLEGTENRIAVERKNFNETARAYNTKTRQFPTNIVAGLFNFDKKGYFEADEGAEKAPEVKF